MAKKSVEVNEVPQATPAPFADLTSARLVHYVDYDGNHRAAVITTVCDAETGHVNLFVFPDGAHPYDLPGLDGACPVNVMYDGEATARRSWHWVEAA